MNYTKWGFRQLKSRHKLQCFLHVDALRSKNGIYSSQWKYVLELPEEFGLLETHLSKTPIKQSMKLSKSDGEPLLNASYHGRQKGRVPLSHSDKAWHC